MKMLYVGLFLFTAPIFYIGCAERQEPPNKEQEYKQYVSSSKEIIANGFKTPENQKEVQEPKINEQAANDAKIMEARKFIADYDTRMEAVQKFIKECIKSGNHMNVCTVTGYDMNGFYRSGDGDGNQLATSEKDAYRENSRIAKESLSTEINGAE